MLSNREIHAARSMLFDFQFSSHSGSEGLLKLWTIRSNECVKTCDQHLDKVQRTVLAPLQNSHDIRLCICEWKNIALSTSFIENVKYQLRLEKEGEKLY